MENSKFRINANPIRSTPKVEPFDLFDPNKNAPIKFNSYLFLQTKDTPNFTITDNKISMSESPITSKYQLQHIFTFTKIYEQSDNNIFQMISNETDKNLYILYDDNNNDYANSFINYFPNSLFSIFKIANDELFDVTNDKQYKGNQKEIKSDEIEFGLIPKDKTLLVTSRSANKKIIFGYKSNFSILHSIITKSKTKTNKFIKSFIPNLNVLVLSVIHNELNVSILSKICPKPKSVIIPKNENIGNDSLNDVLSIVNDSYSNSAKESMLLDQMIQSYNDEITELSNENVKLNENLMKTKQKFLEINEIYIKNIEMKEELCRKKTLMEELITKSINFTRHLKNNYQHFSYTVKSIEDQMKELLDLFGSSLEVKENFKKEIKQIECEFEELKSEILNFIQSEAVK